MKTAHIGSIISGTLRHEDLIPAFCSELRYLGHQSRELTRIERDSVKPGYYDNSEESGYDLEMLSNMLDEHALPYMFFGSHPGDGADFGFWVSDLTGIA